MTIFNKFGLWGLQYIFDALRTVRSYVRDRAEEACSIIFFRLELISKEVGKSNCLQIFNKSMQATPFSQEFEGQLVNTPVKSHKRSLPLPEDSDPEDLQPIKKTLFKMSQNSIGFSDTINTCSKLSNSFINRGESQHIRSQDKKQDPNFTVQLVKSQLLFNRGSKIKNWKRLLPKELITNLSPFCQNMLKISALIDQILLRKSSYQHMDAFDNIKSEILAENNVEISLCQFKQINFISDRVYCFYQDPLKNLVIGLPSAERHPSSRKKRLRIHCYEFAQRIRVQMEDNSQQDFQMQMPQKQLQIERIERFFPIKVKNNHKRKQQSLLQEQFVQRIEEQMCLRDHELMKESQNYTGRAWIKSDLSKFADEIIKLYNHHKVKNMFRASLLEWFNEQGRSSDTIISGLLILENLGVFLHSHVSIGKSKIYELNEAQKQLALTLLYGRE